MKVLGYILIAIGLIWLLIAFNMDTSVSTGGSLYLPDRVENLGLIAQRQNHLFIGGLITLVGVLLSIAGHLRRPDREVPGVEVKSIPLEPPGDRDLTADPYRLWLAAKYDIQRDTVFDKFIVKQQTFGTLDDALAFAHSLELERLDEARQREAERRAELERLQQKRLEDIARSDAFLKKVLIGFVALMIVSSPFLYKFAKDANAASRQRQLAEAEQAREVLAGWGLPPSDQWSGLVVTQVKEGDTDDTWCDSKSGILAQFSVLANPHDFEKSLSLRLGQGSSPYSFGDGVNDTVVDRVYEKTRHHPGLRLTAIKTGGSDKESSIYLCEANGVLPPLELGKAPT